MRRPLTCLIFTACLVACGPARAAGGQPSDGGWPQWRGPERTGATAVAPEPTAAAGYAPSWSVEVGTGHASPLVVGERVYVFSRIDDRETLSAIALDSGELLWRVDYEAPYRMNMAAYGHGKGPKSTPVLADGRLFTLGIGGILSAWDAASGRRLWQHTFDGRFRATAPTYGAAMSPLVDGERLIAHVGGNGDGALTAFDVATGRELWRWSGDGPGYASPVIGKIDGVRQLVTFSQRQLVGLDPATGTLLWSLPFVTDYEQNAVTPLLHDRFVIVSGLDRGTSAVRPTLRGERWSAETIWHTDAVSLYMSSPVPAAGRVCGMSHLRKGELFCLDPETGVVAWKSDGRVGDNAALIAAGRWVWALADGADLTVFDAAADAFDPVARWQVADSETWAHPVLLADGWLVKDKTRLTRWRAGAAP